MAGIRNDTMKLGERRYAAFAASLDLLRALARAEIHG